MENRIRRLELWNRVWLALLFLGILGVSGNAFVNSITAHEKALRVEWLPSGEVRLNSSSDGPFVVTHLVRYGNIEPEKSVAQLPQPIVIIDSHGVTIEKSVAEKLLWIDIFGQPIAAPKTGSEIQALFYSPEVAIRRP